MWAYALPALLAASDVLSNESVMRFMNIAMGIMASHLDTKRNLIMLNNEIQRFVDENRNPTNEEWEALLNRSNDAHERIQNA